MAKLLSALLLSWVIGCLLVPAAVAAADPLFYELYEAASKGDLARVKRLMAAGARVNATDGHSTALIGAAALGRTEVVRYLVAKGARLEAKSGGLTPLAHAVCSDDLLSVHLLVANGACLDGAGCFEHSPLHYAIEKGRFDLAKWLLLHGANPNLPGWHDDTALMQAVGHPDLLRVLLRLGARVNAKEDKGHTALSYAISEKETECVRILLAHGARQHRCRWDESAVMVAVEAGTPEILQLLLQYHPRLDTRRDDPAHQTALEMALEQGRKEAARILREHGAR